MASKSFKKFKTDMDDLYISILSITLYSFFTGYVYTQRDKLEFKGDVDKQLFEDFFTFQKQTLVFNNLLVSLVSSLETYLQDRLIEEIESNESSITRFFTEVEIPKKLTKQDVLNGPLFVVRELLTNTVYHNLKKANAYYKCMFGLDILNLMKNDSVWKIINKRHDIAHRSGRIEDKRIRVTQVGICQAMTSICNWVENIDFYLLNGREKKSFSNYMYRFGKKVEEVMRSSVLVKGMNIAFEKTEDYDWEHKKYINV